MKSSPRSADRLARCIVAAVVLGGLCCAYVGVSSRWLDVDRQQQARPRTPSSVTDSHIDESNPAQQWFPEHPWLQSPSKTYRYEKRWLFADELESTTPEDTDPSDPDAPAQTLTLSPVAVLWESDDPNEDPIRATAASAEVNLAERLAMQQSDEPDSQVGRIISGVLKGDVRIRGPKNLRIDGREFHIDEKSLTLRSSRPVSFAWEGHTGHATGGIKIQLASDGKGDAGLFDVSDIRSVQLRGRVECLLDFPARRRGEENVKLEVLAAGGFDFDLHTGLGTFHGFPKLGYDPQNQVLVKRLTATAPDVLLCARLDVEFHPEISPETGQPAKSRRRLARVAARGGAGRPVVYVSPEHNLCGKMSTLEYFVAEKRLEMKREDTSADGRALPVRIWQTDPTQPPGEMNAAQVGNVLEVFPSGTVAMEADGSANGQPGGEARGDSARAQTVATVRILHGDDNSIDRIECDGRGIIRQGDSPESASDKATPATVRWNRRLTVQRKPGLTLHRILLEGGSHVTLPRDGMSLSARTIDFVVDAIAAPSAAGSQPSPDVMSLNLTDAEPRLLTAEGDVVIRSPDATGNVRDRLTVRFQPIGTVGHPPGVMMISSSREQHSTGEGLSHVFGANDSNGEIRFSTTEMEAHVTLTDGQNAAWNRVQLTGDVHVERASAEPADQFAAEGNVIVATNEPDGNAKMHLFGDLYGDPATIRSQAGYVEGARIDLDQSLGTAEINGSGRIQIVTDKDFDGNPLPGPVPIDIFWTDSMKLEGSTARFVGNIRVDVKAARFARTDEQSHDIKLRVPEMLVHFTQPIRMTGGATAAGLRFTGTPDRPVTHREETPEIERVDCVGRVTIDAHSHESDRQVSRHLAELVDLTINMETGRFEAKGDGWIESTNPSDTEQLQVGSAVKAQANAKTEIHESAFARVRASFIDRLEGNMQTQNLTLLHRVSVVFAPVAELDEVIDLEAMPADEMPDDSGLLRAEKMVVNVIPGTDSKFFSVTASGNARLESREISGDADVITYDRSKEQYVLAADDERPLTVHHREGNTGRYQIVHGPRIEYYRHTGAIIGNISRMQATD